MKCYNNRIKKEGFLIISINDSLQKQFNAFCKKNKLQDMEEAVKYFTIFGGLDIIIDTSIPLLDLIEKEILEKYNYFRNNISALTGGYHVDQAVLSGAASGDRRTHSSFKRAHVSDEEGMKCVENLCEKGIIETESSLHFLANQRGDSKISKKILFTTPFLRFWFAFVSPIYKGIKDGDFKEFKELYQSRHAEFSDFIFEELAMEYLRDSLVDDPAIKLGKYWDDKIEIDVLVKTKSGKIIAGMCKNSNSKMKKTVLSKLKEDCQTIGLKVDTFVLFGKSGFSSELKSQKSETLRLYTVKSFKLLITK